ncbi:elongation factor Ts [Actinoalloteichus hoggarensis]|uniref:Elongation factor Ts n=1 Tax=Actinoalloteichus hoggarensis TaxID=1470176 RepID=A0A221W0Q4_9PSEU|nr:translation elongation factor Ts [Actinoalloteichus hoggarensis]ASO19328.1 Elongation factor Ts [Actinoalloteichus hoggarensis]MBB5920566.1 elongation factor Ts [Actinoalloteichus hoggarensis]
MANYTAADVKRLRELTGSGMMDCKKALEQTDGDMDKAVEILRIKGAKDVGKRAERVTANGLVAADGGVLLELNCETDFVAKTEAFEALAAQIVAAAKANSTGDVAALKAAPTADGKTVDELVQEQSAKIGEKLEIRRVVCFDGPVSVYLHRRSSDLPPAVGVLVEFEGGSEQDARGIAMQIAALAPRYVTRDEVPADLVENERRIAEQTAREENKPEAALSRIVEGRLNGFFKDVVLVDQPSVQDSKKQVKALLSDAGMTVKRFARFEVGQA